MSVSSSSKIASSLDLPVNILITHSLFVFHSSPFRSLDSTVEQQRLKKLKERKVEYIHSFEYHQLNLNLGPSPLKSSTDDKHVFFVIVYFWNILDKRLD